MASETLHNPQYPQPRASGSRTTGPPDARRDVTRAPAPLTKVSARLRSVWLGQPQPRLSTCQQLVRHLVQALSSCPGFGRHSWNHIPQNKITLEMDVWPGWTQGELYSKGAAVMWSAVKEE
ncbi:uncharacterized protein LOC143266866 [Peromyscus maniculatus bairdii]|uniref:uncharacterized protein LOC143266866 n=1 Tax=Peromyscus maniculatus bairdii TaxID=230844 RepID=UPI003FCF9AC0